MNCTFVLHQFRHKKNIDIVAALKIIFRRSCEIKRFFIDYSPQSSDDCKDL
jgi:hypothetical protein